MPNLMDRKRLKDRVVESISKAVNKIQEIQYATGQADVVLTNDSWQLQKLVEHFDHAFLHGLRHITNGYWVVVQHFTHKATVKEINHMQHVTTNLGRGRAWLLTALSDHLLESYVRCFTTDLKLIKKYYVKEALVLDQQRMEILLTLSAGLEYVTFQVDIDMPYLDLATHIRSRSNSQEEEDDERSSIGSLESCASASSRSTPVSLSRDTSCDQDISSITSSRGTTPPPAYAVTNGQPEIRELKTSISMTIIEESPVDEPLPRGFRFERMECIEINESEEANTELEVIRVKAKGRKKDKKKGGKKKHDESQKLLGKSREGSPVTPNNSSVNSETKSLTTPESESGYSAEVASGTSADSGCYFPGLEFETEGSQNDISQSGRRNLDTACSYENTCNAMKKGKHHIGGLQIPNDSGETHESKIEVDIYSRNSILDESDGSVEDAIDGRNKPADKREHNCEYNNLQNCSDRSSVVTETPTNQNLMQHVEEILVPSMTVSFTENSQESSQTNAKQNSDNTIEECIEKLKLCDDQIKDAEVTCDTTVPNGIQQLEEFEQNEINPKFGSYTKEEEWNDIIESPYSLKLVEKDIASLSNSPKHEIKMSSDDEGEIHRPNTHPITAGKPQLLHPNEMRIDNNMKLLLMLHIFQDDEENFVRMFQTCTGHTEGDLSSIYLLLTTKAMYFLVDHVGQCKFKKESVVHYIEMDYISLSLSFQVINIVCTNRRKQFWITTGDEELTKCIVSQLDNAVRLSELDLPRLSVLTDATTQKISLKKWLAQECSTEQSETSALCYTLCHWEEATSSSEICRMVRASKEGVLLYKTSGYMFGLAGGYWKPSYFVLKDGVLYQYEDQHDTKVPKMCIQMQGEDCSGCRRTPHSDKANSFELILSHGTTLQLCAESGGHANSWIQSLLQSVSEGMGAQRFSNGAIVCCAVVSPTRILMCHEDVQTNFFRTLGSGGITDVSEVLTDQEVFTYCVVTFESQEVSVSTTRWIIYFNAEDERDKFITALAQAWSSEFQISLPVNQIGDTMLQTQCREGVARVRPLPKF